jgi:2',3'-cyclic-nucleotide 2'-phosphodiesterase (5'-nucleotidase family)
MLLFLACLLVSMTFTGCLTAQAEKPATVVEPTVVAAPEPVVAEPAPVVEAAPEPMKQIEKIDPASIIMKTSGDPLSDFTIVLAHTNDTHGRVLEGSYDGMGFAKISTAVNYIRSVNPELLLLDAGDALHGTTFATLVEGESIVDIMNVIGYDAMVPGNHDFNYGYERLLELSKNNAEFSIISANVMKDGKTLFNPYKIFDYHGVKVGVFGLTTSETLYKTHPKRIEGLTFEDSVMVAQDMVDILSQECDIIIALAHLGVDKTSTDTSIRVAEQVSGIDVIVDGHSHTTLPEGLKVNETYIVQTGNYDKNLGIVELAIKDGKFAGLAMDPYLFTKEEATEKIVAGGEFEPDANILAMIKGLQDQQDVILSEVIGYTGVVLEGEREQVRTRPTNLSKMITAAMIEATGADCALTNGGGIRASIDVGEITKGEVITVLPFNNTCVVIEVTGAELYAAVENGLAGLPDASGAYCQLGNIVASYNRYNDPGQRVYKLKINGNDVDPNATYKLATNDFTAAGGDQYTMFTGKPLKAEVGTLDQVLIDYIAKHYPVQ